MAEKSREAAFPNPSADTPAPAPGFRGARALLSQQGQGSQAASEGLSILLSQAYSLGLKSCSWRNLDPARPGSGWNFDHACCRCAWP